MKVLILPLVVLLCLVSPVFGQTTFGSITGTVTDPTGAVIPGATVSVTNEGTGIERKVTASAGGIFNVPNLDVGAYRVAVDASGFARYERPGLVLSSNQILNVDARLELATTATLTEVRGAMSAISTETSSLTDVKTNDVMERLPLQMSRHLADKGFYTYTFLNTGTSSVTYTSLPVINGVRNESGVLPTMDGIAVTAYSGGASPVQPSLEGVQEVNVVTGNPPAEFAVAANYTVVTKSGTNELHGSAFYNYNSHALNARDFFSDSAPFRVYNNFGGGIGGPIKKNKIFFFGDYEGSREAAKNLMVVDTPLPAWRNGDFRSLDFALTDPSTGQPFANNVIPPERISAVSKKVQDGLFPLPNFGPASLEAANYRREYPGTTGFTRFNQFDVRADYNFSSRDVVFARVSWRRMPLDYTDLVPTIGKVTQRRYGHSAVASWNHTFSPAVVNEFRTGMTYHRNSYFLDVIGSDLIQQWGIEGVTTTGIHDAPILRIDPVTYVDYDDYDDSYYNNPSTTLQWIDNLSWTRGRHFVKFGVDVIRDRLNETAITSLIYGGYNFTGVYSGFGYADFLLGIPQTSELAVPTPPRYLRGTTTGLYVQDQFKVNRKLTLNYGIRWELMGPFSHKLGPFTASTRRPAPWSFRTKDSPTSIPTSHRTFPSKRPPRQVTRWTLCSIRTKGTSSRGSVSPTNQPIAEIP